MSNILSFLTPRLAVDTDSCVVGEGLVTFVNPYSYSQLRRHGSLLSAFEKIGVDGISMVWLLRFFLGIRVGRVSFDMTSLAPLVFRKLAREGSAVFLIGSTSAEASNAQLRLSEAFPGLRIAGVRSGYFDTENDRKASIEHIIALNPEVVVAGMGAPVQEQFLVDLRRAGWRGAGYTCGGFFHQVARKLAYYPAWVDRLHLRWAYRMWDEPRLMRRYGVDYPCAAVAFVTDTVRFARQRLE